MIQLPDAEAQALSLGFAMYMGDPLAVSMKF